MNENIYILYNLFEKLESMQCAKKVMSDSSGLVDFAIGLVNSVVNLPNSQVMFLSNSNNRRTMNSIPLVRKCLRLVEMTSGLVNASFSLPEWQAVKMIFFAPCSGTTIQGTPLGPMQVSPEWRLGWGLLIINQQIKCFSFILPRISCSQYCKSSIKPPRGLIFIYLFIYRAIRERTVGL